MKPTFTEEFVVKTAKAGYVYHVTYQGNIVGISLKGLVRNMNPNPWGGGMQPNAQLGNFYCLPKNVSHWVHHLEQMASHEYEFAGWRPDNVVDEGMVPVVLRFRFNMPPTREGVRWHPDPHGNLGGGDYRTTKAINPAGIEMWTGREWTTDLDPAAVHLDLMVDKYYDPHVAEDYEGTGDGPPSPEEAFYWEFKPYPLPPECR
jgi:hypothetical protein